MWCEFDGTHILVNLARGRQKDRNMRRDPRVSRSVVDSDNSYRYLEVRGEVRVSYRIQPQHATSMDLS